MMSANDISNEPVRFAFGALEVWARRLPALKILAMAENYVLERRMRMLAAKDEEGEDVGKEAMKLVLGKAPTELVVRWLNAAIVSPRLSEDALYEASEKASGDEVAALMAHALSVDKKKDGS